MSVNLDYSTEDIPCYVQNAESNIGLHMFSTQIDEIEAKRATESAGLQFCTAYNVNNSCSVIFENDEMTHEQATKVASKLVDSQNTDGVHATTFLQRRSLLSDAKKDGKPHELAPHTRVSIDSDEDTTTN
jgi:hypothetical protein